MTKILKSAQLSSSFHLVSHLISDVLRSSGLVSDGVWDLRTSMYLLACFNPHVCVNGQTWTWTGVGLKRQACAQCLYCDTLCSNTTCDSQVKSNSVRYLHSERTDSYSLHTEFGWNVRCFGMVYTGNSNLKSLSSPPSNIFLKCLFQLLLEHLRRKSTGSDTWRTIPATVHV